MPHLRHILLALIVICTTSPAACLSDDAPSAAHKERESFARDFAQAVITILHDPGKKYGDRKNTLRQAFTDSVDTDWIARFALGRAWRNASDAQREQYTTLYRKFLTETYVTRFAESPGKGIYAIKILGIIDGENADAFTVRTHIQLMDRSDLNVDYLVSEKDGSRKVQDIIIENVSLINTHRAQFAELAARDGVDAVIRTLAEWLDQGKTELTLSMK